MKNSVPVVIDLHNDLTKHHTAIIEKVNEAIDWAGRKELRVVYIQHNNLSAGTRTFKPGTCGAELVPEMKVVSDYIFTKSKSKVYHGKTVVDHLDISVKSGTVFGLLGANGAGKSTAIESMLGTKQADSGTVRLLGQDPKKRRRTLLLLGRIRDAEYPP